MTEKKECFMCKRRYFTDDPEFNAEKRICDSCAEALENDNPYTYLGDYFTIDEFCKHLDNGGITSYDGIGYYIFGSSISGERVDFNSTTVRNKAAKKGYIGVVWYNR